MPKVGTPASTTALIVGTEYSPVAAGIARAVRQEHAVGFSRQHILGGRRRRQHRHRAALVGEKAKDVPLDAVVDGDDVERRLAVAVAVAFALLATSSRPR